MLPSSKGKKNCQFSKQIRYFEKDLVIYCDYNENLNAWRLSYIESIKKNLLDKTYKKKVLLDIGAGSGYVSIEMAKLGINVIASDLTPLSIKNLKKFKKEFNLSNLEIIHCSADKIPLPDGSVDYLVANAVLEHIPDEEKTINEWKRVLKKQGKMFIVVPLKFRFIWPFFWPINFINDRMVGHLRRYDLESIERKFLMEVKIFYYTGHFKKMVWLLLSRLFVLSIRKNIGLDEYFEKVDFKSRNRRYGASNLIVILEK